MTRHGSDSDDSLGLPPDAPFGELLRAHRLAAGMSQEGLADRSSVSARTISDLERGVRSTPQSHPATLIADALGLDGEPRQHYFESIRRQRLPRGTAAVRITPELPRAAAAILGREEELGFITERFAAGDRIVTLIGPGGVGKTRLALELAARREASAPGSVIWLALDLVSAPSGVLPSIARACGVRDRSSGSLPARIAEALANRDALLVLDNAEHLLDAMAFLPEMLASAPRVAALVTSREDLRVSGERVVRIEPLPLPRRQVSRSTVAENPAVSLYLDRLGTLPNSRTDAGAIDEAAAAVRMLDGLPLAIELAAAQAVTLPRSVLPGLLAAAGLDALARGRRDTPGRFRTMDAAIAWSVDLLPPGADRLLPLLGVFHGGFTTEAVSAITAAAGAPDAMAALPALANAQLVLPGSAAAGPRFRLLEPVRLFARDRLREAGVRARAAGVHAQWFLAWGKRQAAAIDGPDPVPALDAVEADLPNLRAAIVWATGNGEADAAIETAVALRRFFDFRGYPGEFRSMLDGALAATNPDAPPSHSLMDALFWSAIFANMQGDAETSRARTERLRALATGAGSTDYAVRAELAEWGRAGASAETRAGAGAFLRNALSLLGDGDDDTAAGDAAWMLWLCLGVDLQESGDPAAAIPLLDRAAASAAQRGCALDQPLPLARLGLTLLDLGQDHDAQRRLEESLAISARLDAEVIALFSLLGLARLDAASDDPDAAVRAARLLGAADAIVARQALSYGPYWEGVVSTIRARLAASLGQDRLDDLSRDGGEAPLSGLLGAA